MSPDGERKEGEVGLVEPFSVAFLDSNRDWGGGQAWAVATAERLVARGHRVALVGKEGSALVERARARGLDALAGRLSYARASRLAQVLRERGTRGIVANAGRDVRLGALLARLSGARLAQRRGLLRPLRGDPLTRALYRGPVRRVVANCEAIRRVMTASAPWADPARFRVIPNAVEPAAPRDRTEARARLGLPPTAPIAGVLARLAPMKGHAGLLAAWGAVRERLPEACLVVAGEGELEAELRAKAAPLGGAVRWFGFRDDPADVLAALDLLVVPSARDEGASNALLEAMAAGRPAVVTRVGGLPELCEDGETGIVVPPADSPALAAAAVDLLGDPERLQRAGEAARMRASRRFSWSVVLPLWETLLAELCSAT